MPRYVSSKIKKKNDNRTRFGYLSLETITHQVYACLIQVSSYFVNPIQLQMKILSDAPYSVLKKYCENLKCVFLV